MPSLNCLLLYALVFVAHTPYFCLSETNNCTRYVSVFESFQENVLKRRTRSVIFPNKGMVLLTLSFTKAILGGIPRGLGYSMEFDMYHSLPDTLDGWKPTLLINQIEKGKQHVQTQQLVNITKTNSDMPLPQVDTYLSEIYTAPTDESDYGLYQSSFNEYEFDHNSWNFADARANYGPGNYFIKGDKTQQHLTQIDSRPQGRDQQYESNLYDDPERSEFSDSNMDSDRELSSWFTHQNYRERRQIYDQIETVGKILNLNLKACIQRAMCEMTTYLKPYGESVIDDIIRIMLTIPRPPKTSSSYEKNDYGHRYDGVNCAFRFAKSCPYRVMDFLKQNLMK